MKTLVLYYSYGGKTRDLARAEAQKRGADLAEVKDQKRPSMLRAFLVGCPQAMRHQGWTIASLPTDLAGYDTIVLMAPIWASHPAPAFHSAVAALPPGKSVEVIAVSSSGKSAGQDRVAAQILGQGCRMASYIDVKAGG